MLQRTSALGRCHTYSCECEVARAAAAAAVAQSGIVGDVDGDSGSENGTVAAAAAAVAGLAEADEDRSRRGCPAKTSRQTRRDGACWPPAVGVAAAVAALIGNGNERRVDGVGGREQNCARRTWTGGCYEKKQSGRSLQPA